MVAVLAAIDQDPAFFDPATQSYDIEIGPGNVAGFCDRPRLSDQELRRYIARRVYDEYSRGDMDVLVGFGEMDLWLTGNQAQDFLRNTQVLEAEGYLRMHRAMGVGNFDAQPTARLVRDVERYGSAREDAISSGDYESLVRSSPTLVRRFDSIMLEHRAVFPCSNTRRARVRIPCHCTASGRCASRGIEGKGATRDLPTLGTMISELQQRRLDGVHIYSQLNRILKFARDLEQHGAQLPMSVLRIAAANAFELLPQVANIQ